MFGVTWLFLHVAVYALLSCWLALVPSVYSSGGLRKRLSLSWQPD
jgi:hypothetical protein